MERDPHCPADLSGLMGVGAAEKAGLFRCAPKPLESLHKVPFASEMRLYLSDLYFKVTEYP